MRNILVLLAFLIPSLLPAAEQQKKPRVLVSVAPYKYFVERIAGNTVDVSLVVPAGTSSHTYEPTPKQALAFAGSDVWFQIGEGFEANLERALKSQNSSLQVVSLRKGINLIHAPEGEHKSHCCGKDMIDLHFWLSTREVAIQVRNIAAILSEKYPDNAPRYSNSLEALLSDLAELDGEIKKLLHGEQGKVLFVSHPAYAYYARDYGLEQLAVEFEGKDPTPQQLTSLLKRARDANVKVVFIQPQYPSKGARLIADQLGGRVVTVDPYSENYLENMLEMSRLFAGAVDAESAVNEDAK